MTKAIFNIFCLYITLGVIENHIVGMCCRDCAKRLPCYKQSHQEVGQDTEVVQDIEVVQGIYDADEINQNLIKTSEDVFIVINDVFDSSDGDTNKNCHRFIQWFKKHKNDGNLKNKMIKFIDMNEGKKNQVHDDSGLRRQMFTNTKNFILANENLFKTIQCDDKVYYDFTNNPQLNDKTYSPKDTYQLLGYMLAISLRAHFKPCQLFLNLNPLIYKIILNQCNITNKFFDKEDLQYYAKAIYDSVDEQSKNDYMGELRNYFSSQINSIKIFYNSFCKFFNIGDFNILNFFKKNEFLKLKNYLEGDDNITYDMFINGLQILLKQDDDMDKQNELYDIFTDIIKTYSSDDLRKLFIAITGTENLPANSKFFITFYNAELTGNLPLRAQTCSMELQISLPYFRNLDYDESKNTMKEYLNMLLNTYEFITEK